ncbi:protein of unknown function [Bradyrhizobium vignae]|uniref:Uncharacterized protein n=1 Tax=Bradyrhizobium vignae TaxID=1549949 RepID=A0A2U3QBJ5_9BRAD|nr:protein of unknown function [Bradyrhizobium vignae]
MRTDQTSQSFAAAAIGFAVTVQLAATRRKEAMLGSGERPPEVEIAGDR